jgi:hypothetical protein
MILCYGIHCPLLPVPRIAIHAAVNDRSIRESEYGVNGLRGPSGCPVVNVGYRRFSRTAGNRRIAGDGSACCHYSPSNQVKSYLQFQQVHNSKSSTLFYWKTLIKTKGITLVPGAPKVIFHQIPRPEDKYRNDSRHVLCLIIWYAWQKLSSRALEVDKRICGQG